MTDAKIRETEQHTLYLSNTVWGELKRRAVLEGSDASKITNYVLDTFLKFLPAVRLPQRRARAATKEKLNRRNLHLHKDAWQRVVKVAAVRKYSISVLTEFLLRSYLGLEIGPDLRLLSPVKLRE